MVTPGSARPRLHEVAPAVFYADGADGTLVAADIVIIDYLKAAARTAPLRRARFCAHPDPAAAQHDMLIVSHRDSYVAPHRHLTKSETMLVVEGEAESYSFDEAGGLVRVLRLGTAGSGRTFFCRTPPRQYHSLRIDSEFLVFVESTMGPFRRTDSEDAPWAPAALDSAAGHRFLDEVRARAAALGL